MTQQQPFAEAKRIY